MLIKKILRVISWVLTAIFVLTILFNVTCYIKRTVGGDTCPTVFGFGSAVVISGSMEPTISLNDLVIFRASSSYEPEEDIIIFKNGNYPVTHRLMSMRTDESGQIWITTKGDANNACDSETEYENIVGKVILTIPRVGYLKDFLQTPLGFLLLVLTIGFFILLPEWIDRLKKQKGR